MNPGRFLGSTLRPLHRLGLLRAAIVGLALLLPVVVEGADWNAPHQAHQLIVCVRKAHGAESMWSTAPYVSMGVDSVGLPSSLETRMAAAGVLTVGPLLPAHLGALASDTLSAELQESLEDLEPSRYLLVQVDSTQDLAVVADSIAADTTVAYVEPNYLLTYEAVPNDSYYFAQTNLLPDNFGIDAQTAWDSQTGNPNVVLGILDSGLDYRSYDLNGGRWGYPYCKVINWRDYFASASLPVDDNYHGTAVATIAAGLTNNGDASSSIAGVAGGWVTSSDHFDDPHPGCKIVGLRIDSSEDYPTVSNAVNALGDAVLQYHCDILVMAWGTNTESSALLDQVEWVARRGKVMVTSKGNDNHDTDVYPHYPSDFQGGRWTVSVGAITGGRNNGNRAVGGDGTWPAGTGSNYNGNIDICAPGTDIYGSTPIYKTSTMQARNIDGEVGVLSGTSYAAAEVAGVAALVESEARDSSSAVLHPDDVQGILNGSASRYWGAYNGEHGWGEVNARQAVEVMRLPWTINRFTSTGGTAQATTDWSANKIWTINTGLPVDGTYYYKFKRTPVRKTIAFNTRYDGTPFVWTRGIGVTTGWLDYPNAIFGDGGCRVVSQTATSVTLETNIYSFKDPWGNVLAGPYPTDADHVVFGYAVMGVPADTIAPATVSDLAVAARGRTSLRLEWTDTGDDGTTGTATAYDLRYSSSAIGNESAFQAATPIELGAPQVAGSAGCVVVDGLSASHTYYFALKLVDDKGNWSGLNSNVSGTTLGGSHYEEVEECPYPQRPMSAVTAKVQPLRWALSAARPSPTTAGATIDFSVKTGSHVVLSLYDITGRLVRTLVDGRIEAGPHSVVWDGRSNAGVQVRNGVYFYRMTAPSWSGNRRLVVIGR